MRKSRRGKAKSIETRYKGEIENRKNKRAGNRKYHEGKNQNRK
jgi:hypothetical protein